MDVVPMELMIEDDEGVIGDAAQIDKILVGQGVPSFD
jgi:hypothetical protein